MRSAKFVKRFIRSTHFYTNPQFRLGPTRPTDPLRAQRDANFGSGPLDRPTLSTARMAVGSKFECVFCYSDCNWVGPTRPTDPLGPQTMGRTNSIDRLTLDPDLNRLTNFALRTALATTIQKGKLNYELNRFELGRSAPLKICRVFLLIVVSS